MTRSLWYSISLFFLLSHHISYGLWPDWLDTIVSKLYNTTDLIVHKEFYDIDNFYLDNHHGPIVIHSWKQNYIALEIISTCADQAHKYNKISYAVDNKNLIIQTTLADEKIKCSVTFNILAPENMHMFIKTGQSDISINDVSGSINAMTKYGNIKLINPYQPNEITTNHGSITIRTEKISPTAVPHIVCDKGSIFLYTTPSIRVKIQAQALQGTVTSQIPITITPITTQLNQQAWKRFRQEVTGFICEPLAHLTMTARQGSIFIAPYLE